MLIVDSSLMVGDIIDFKTVLTEQFNSDDKCGIVYVDDSGVVVSQEDIAKRCDEDPYFEARSIFADGSSATCCTNYAWFIAECYAGRTRIFGFVNDNNPNSRVAREKIHLGGHDFAIIDEQYLVDPWILLVANRSDQIVFDLLDPDDRVKVLDMYGDASCWKVMDTFESDESYSL